MGLNNMGNSTEMCIRMKQVILIHFGELWLKGRNRIQFIEQLKDNVLSSIKHGSYSKFEVVRDRFIVYPSSKAAQASILKSLGYVFGISWYGVAYICKNDIASIMKCLTSMSRMSAYKGKEVKIEAHRSDKSLPFTSNEIISELLRNKDELGFILESSSPYKISVNPTSTSTFIYCEKSTGLGGLPVGSSGNCVVLLSGGIDSPVAAFYAMKRGLKPIYVHFHAFRNNSEAHKSKISSLIKTLSVYSNESVAYMFPSYIFESQMVGTGTKNEMVVLKRFMFEVAGMVADEEDAQAIITGGSLGQVASQTVRNLEVSGHWAKYLILRPLIGFDKSEIVEMAKRIGTYRTSIIKYKDVCSFRAANPTTSSNLRVVDRIYKQNSISDAAKATMSKGSRYAYRSA